MEAGGLGLHAQRVLLRVRAKAAPLLGRLIENDGPVFLAGNNVQAVSAGRQLLSVHEHVIGYSELGRFVCARAPHMAVWCDGKILASAGRSVNCSFTLSGGTPCVR